MAYSLLFLHPQHGVDTAKRLMDTYIPTTNSLGMVMFKTTLKFATLAYQRKSTTAT